VSFTNELYTLNPTHHTIMACTHYTLQNTSNRLHTNETCLESITATFR